MRWVGAVLERPEEVPSKASLMAEETNRETGEREGGAAKWCRVGINGREKRIGGTQDSRDRPSVQLGIGFLRFHACRTDAYC